MALPNKTKVSIIIPVRNEENSIGRCLDSFIYQTYPGDLIEIIVVDGMSRDNTRKTVAEYSQRTHYPSIILLSNPGRITPLGLNVGVKAASGDMIIIFSGHAAADRDFVAMSVQYLSERPNVSGVGGKSTFVGLNYISKAIGAVRGTPIGGGLSPYRFSNKEQYVRTIVYGAYRRDVFEKVGLFDEDLLRNQDNEFNSRVLAAGGVLLFSPQIRSAYYGRSTLGHLFLQMFSYGYWKPAEYRKCPGAFRISEVAPLALVISIPPIALGLLPMASAVLHVFSWLVLGSYVAVVGAGALLSARIGGWKYALLSPALILLIHCAIGLGEIGGFARLAKNWSCER